MEYFELGYNLVVNQLIGQCDKCAFGDTGSCIGNEDMGITGVESCREYFKSRNFPTESYFKKLEQFYLDVDHVGGCSRVTLFGDMIKGGKVYADKLYSPIDIFNPIMKGYIERYSNRISFGPKTNNIISSKLYMVRENGNDFELMNVDYRSKKIIINSFEKNDHGEISI